MKDTRYARQIALFGEAGQERLHSTHCVVAGVGGIGTHLVQQLSLLGVRQFTLIDDEEVSDTNRNRYVGLRHDDPIPGFKKVDLGERIAHDIDPSIVVHKVPDNFVSEKGFSAIRSGDTIFAGLDIEGARLVLNDVCMSYGKSYFDLATDVIPGDPIEYGGRICISVNGNGCIQCLGQLDTKEAGKDLAGDAELRNREAIYGVDRNLLGGTGPSVVSINGIIASLAVTEFMVAVTGLRDPNRVLTYKGSSGKVFSSLDEPSSDCYYCKGRWGLGDKVDIEHYLRDGTAQRLRRS